MAVRMDGTLAVEMDEKWAEWTVVQKGVKWVESTAALWAHLMAE